MKDIKKIFYTKKPERNKKIFELFQEKQNLAAVAKIYKLSRERVRQICLVEQNRGVDKSTLDNQN